MVEHPKNLFEVKKFIENLGIQCLSSKFINLSHIMEWECSHNHKWNAPLRVILNGQLCPFCDKIEETRSRFSSLKKLAKKKQGKCLSSRYVNEYMELNWECRKKHTWMAQPHEIRKGNWCPHCYELKTNPIKNLNDIAQQHGGQCLSTIYLDDNKSMKWRCALGDIWSTSAEKVKNGQWCPICQFFDSLLIIYLCDDCKVWSIARPKDICTTCPNCKTRIYVANITGFEFVPNNFKANSIINLKNTQNEIPAGYLPPHQIQWVDETHFFPDIYQKITQNLSSQTNVPKISIEYIHYLYSIYIPHFSQNLQSFGSFARFMRYVANLTPQEKNGGSFSFGKGFRFKLKPIQ